MIHEVNAAGAVGAIRYRLQYTLDIFLIEGIQGFLLLVRGDSIQNASSVNHAISFITKRIANRIPKMT